MPLVSFLRKTSSFSKVCFQVTMYVARDIGIQILRYRSVFLEPDFFLTPENSSADKGTRNRLSVKIYTDHVHELCAGSQVVKKFS